MKTTPIWAEKVNHNNTRTPVFDCAFNSDGSQLLIPVGPKIVVFSTKNGQQLHELVGHKDYIFCIDYSFDGKRFATGGADKSVIVWSFKFEGIIKYSHQDPIVALAHNPVTQDLASCSSSDFGFWEPQSKNVLKHKINSNSKITSCSWSSDGQTLALGLFSGGVSLRNRSGEEVQRISSRLTYSF